ncbi:MAG: SDR family oxidoreductase [Ignavibacteria bacterium]|nr:SDR family oxidoreductase [Ignavibacteria bacterium]
MKKALVTGGAKRLGKYLSLFLSTIGYDVAITYHSSASSVAFIKKQVEANGMSFKSYKTNLNSYLEIEKLFINYKKDWEKIDLLINNAGVFPEAGFKSIKEELWDNTFAVNLKSVFFLSQKFSSIMNNDGTIVNISSIGGFEVWKDRILYNTSKAAQIALTRSLARELAPKIRVNSVAPGTIEMEDEKNLKAILGKNKIPLKRYGSPQEICETINFIIKNKYLTGVTIPVEGGKLLT